MPFYDIVMKGRYGGQDIINIPKYRGATVFDDIGLFLGAANALGAQFLASVWDGLGAGIKHNLPTGYHLDTLEIIGYDSLGVLISSDPVIITVDEAGVLSGETNGPANCVVMNANLEPVLGPGIGLPNRGYMAFGPLLDSMVDSTGHLTSTALDNWNNCGVVLGNNIVTEDPVETYFPIRTRKVFGIGGLFEAYSYKDVSRFVANPVAKTRRSRLPEA